MKKGFPFFILIALIFSCNKEEKNDLVWEKSSGRGFAYFIQPAADSGFIAGGQVDGKPYLIKYNSKRDRILEITSANTGLFSSAWSDKKYPEFYNEGSDRSLSLSRGERET